MSSETTPENQRETLQGVIPPLATAAERQAAMDQAFDYRGDVTIRTRDGRTIEGYVYDRRSDVAEPFVRVLLKDSDQRVRIEYGQIERLEFTGRDTAAGKSWETWVKKYAEKRSQGQSASIESEPLED